MYETILTIRKILSGDYCYLKNIKQVVVKYEGNLFAFDKEKIIGLSGSNFIPIEFLNPSTEVYVCSLKLNEVRENNED